MRLINILIGVTFKLYMQTGEILIAKLARLGPTLHIVNQTDKFPKNAD